MRRLVRVPIDYRELGRLLKLPESYRVLYVIPRDLCIYESDKFHVVMEGPGLPEVSEGSLIPEGVLCRGPEGLAVECFGLAGWEGRLALK